VQTELDRRRQRRPGNVVLIGHSRGGILARAIAARIGSDASHLILLGSPIGAIARMEHFGRGRIPDAPAASSVGDASNRARRFLDPDCNVPECGCPFPADLQRPLSAQTKVVSIFSNEDPIVPAWACQIPGGHNLEVTGTHSGLAFNNAVYKALAGVFAKI